MGTTLQNVCEREEGAEQQQHSRSLHQKGQAFGKTSDEKKMFKRDSMTLKESLASGERKGEEQDKDKNLSTLATQYVI